MNSESNRSARRIAAGIAAVLLLVVILFSATFIAHKSHHDCTGEDCPVCAAIRLCEGILRLTGINAAARIPLMPVFLVLLTIPCTLYGFTRNTPVSVKVRMNN